MAWSEWKKFGGTVNPFLSYMNYSTKTFEVTPIQKGTTKAATTFVWGYIVIPNGCGITSISINDKDIGVNTCKLQNLDDGTWNDISVPYGVTNISIPDANKSYLLIMLLASFNGYTVIDFTFN